MERVQTKVHFFAPLTAHSGNCTTATRLRELFSTGDSSDNRFEVTLHNSHTPPTPASANGASSELVGPNDAVLFLHAIHSAPHIRALRHVRCRRKILIFGGTDVNETAENDLERRAMVGRLLECADPSAVDVCVCFSDEFAAHARRLWPSELGGTANHQRCVVIPQSVLPPSLSPSCGLSSRESGNGSGSDACSPLAPLGAFAGSLLAVTLSILATRRRVALLPAGLRSVKDPLFAVEVARALEAAHPGRFALVVVGPPMESDVAEAMRAVAVSLEEEDAQQASMTASASFTGRLGELAERLATNVGSTTANDAAAAAGSDVAALVVWVRSAPRFVLWKAMSDRDRVLCVLNTSRSEGQPQAVLEAMSVGAPVVVRRNPANTAVVEDGVTGLVADTPAGMAAHIVALGDDECFARRLCSAARTYVETVHSSQGERAAYLALLGTA